MRVALLAGLIVSACLLFYRKKFTASAVLAWLPKRAPLAALLLMGLFFAKGLSFFFPLAVLQTVCGAVFPLFSAVLLNLCGTAAAMTLPWLLGRRGRVSFAEIRKRFPILEKARQFRPSGDFLYVCSLRAAGFPFDAVSLYLGSLRIAPGTYFFAGLLGCLPQLVLTTALGAGLAKPSARLLPAVGIGGAICAALLIVRQVVKTRTK